MDLGHVDVEKLRIGYRRGGDGPVLLLLHGAVSDSRVWRVELERFADDFTVVAWDAPGCGGSTDPPASWRMGDFVACLAGFVTALQLAPVHVLGHSWGSTVALELCIRRPDLVRSSILVGGYAGWAGSLPAEEVDRRLAFALQAADATGFDPRSMPGLFSDVMPLDRAEELASIMADIRPTGTRTMALALAESDLRAELPKISAPTLLVCGTEDVRSPPSVSAELHRQIEGSTLTLLPGLGHECYLESPDAFEAAVRPFLGR